VNGRSGRDVAPDHQGWKPTNAIRHLPMAYKPAVFFDAPVFDAPVFDIPCSMSL